MRQDLGLNESGIHPGKRQPNLLVELEPWHRVFARNLCDVVWPRCETPLPDSSYPAPFWSDVFVSRPLPWFRFLESAIFHAAAIAVVCTSSQLWTAQQQVLTRSVFHNSDVLYYDASEYLPPLNSGSAKMDVRHTGDLVYSPQAIISVPPDSDNRTQTIVTPPHVKLNEDVPLPNIIAWSEKKLPIAPVPTVSTTPKLTLPVVDAVVVAPPPQLSTAASRGLLGTSRIVIAPPPVVDAVLRNRSESQDGVIAPPPQVQVSSRIGEISIHPIDVIPPAPNLPVNLPVAPQRVLPTDARAALSESTAAVPPPPSVSSSAASSSAGRLIALGIHPVSPSGPIATPAGNRRGTFAATPEGRPDASGTPASANADNRAIASGVGSGHGNGGAGSSVGGEIPPGLFVGAAPHAEETSSIAGHGKQKASGSGSAPGAAVNPRLMAGITPPRVTAGPRQPVREVSEENATDLERGFFRDRKFYAMTLNSPNLNSAGGSWVVHFAELRENTPGELLAPVPTRAVDPAYPVELMRQNVEGTVTLYAVIHSDGSVGDVRVMQSVDDRLDHYASVALSRWQFRPATRNGTPVALEAIVMIPFRSARHGF